MSKSYEERPLETGSVLQKWTVLERAEDRIQKSNAKAIKFYLCKCECGTVREVRKADLLNGMSRSCGCWRVEVSSEKGRHGTHHMTGTPTYKAWLSMINRCNSKSESLRETYLDRGIKIEDARWDQFENFLEDMGVCPTSTTLDRVDTNKGYSKDNCKWSTKSEQSQNRRKLKNNKSGRTGVCYIASEGKWLASMRFQGVFYRAGLFKEFEDAVQARESLEIKFLGQVRSSAYEDRPDLEVKGEQN